MGMAASQARFLSLVARKNNLEYEGQQINQQRTALSNKTANYYSDLLGMAVPVCPSVEDFTQTVYSFNDGALTNSITSLIAQGDGTYKASYLSSYTDDFAIVSAGATSVVNTAIGDYMVGADKLKALADGIEEAYVINEGFSSYRLTEDGNNFTYTDILGADKTLTLLTHDMIINKIGAAPILDDYVTTNTLVNNYIDSVNVNVNSASGISIPQRIIEQLYYAMWANGVTSITYQDDDNPSSPKNGLCLTITEPNKSLIFGTNKADPTQDQKDFQTLMKNSQPELFQKMINLYIDAMMCVELSYSANSAKYCVLRDASGTVIFEEGYEDRSFLGANSSKNYDSFKSAWRNLWDEIENDTSTTDTEGFNRDTLEWQAEYNSLDGCYVDTSDSTKTYRITEKEVYYDGDDAYLNSLSSDQLKAVAQTELDYKNLLNEKIGEPENGWYVRYLQNSATGEWEPIFYNGDEIANGITDDYSNVRSGVQAYKMGSKQVQNEIKGRDAIIEQDSTGRYINITFVDENGAKSTYALSTSTVTDNDAYNDAMNQYEYDKAIYDQNIEKINAKIEIIQSEDKNMELRLKQLDTEHNALDNEMDAVQKVIEKSVESGFKTFG